MNYCCNMRFKERLQIKSNSGINWRCTTLYYNKFTVHIYFCETLEKPNYFSSKYKLLKEAINQNWGKGYSVRFDRMNYGVYDPNKNHLHVYLKNNNLFAINRDGTAHDKSHGISIPRYVSDRIRSEYPDFIIPPNNFIESAELNNIESQEEILELLDNQEQYKNEILNG